MMLFEQEVVAANTPVILIVLDDTDITQFDEYLVDVVTQQFEDALTDTEVGQVTIIAPVELILFVGLNLIV